MTMADFLLREEREPCDHPGSWRVIDSRSRIAHIFG
jgi:hypothetical protein